MNYDKHNQANELLDSIGPNSFVPSVLQPTTNAPLKRISNSSLNLELP